jgi:hypothetical protein
MDGRGIILYAVGNMSARPGPVRSVVEKLQPPPKEERGCAVRATTNPPNHVSKPVEER